MYTIVVTGATGFLGGAVVRRLLSVGLQHPTAFAEASAPVAPEELKVVAIGRNVKAGQALSDIGATFIRADLTDKDAIIEACKDAQLVIHSAAKCDLWGPYEDFVASNVTATEVIIEACRVNNVPRLVHISTPSVYSSPNDQLDVEEIEDRAGLPMKKMLNYYIETKLIAEERVKASGLDYIILRPRGLFGPGDTTLLPRIVDRLQKKRLPIIGSGSALMDITYIENVVDSVCCAATAPNTALGRIYNITNGESIRFNVIVDLICNRFKVPQPTRRVPFYLAWCVAFLIECVWWILRLRSEPPITRYMVSVLAKTMTLNISRARKLLGYQPTVPLQKGLELALEA
ncbi:hypothetical protein HK102_009874, partial [Quaeritorhiza haematococci]